MYFFFRDIFLSVYFVETHCRLVFPLTQSFFSFSFSSPLLPSSISSLSFATDVFSFSRLSSLVRLSLCSLFLFILLFLPFLFRPVHILFNSFSFFSTFLSLYTFFFGRFEIYLPSLIIYLFLLFFYCSLKFTLQFFSIPSIHNFDLVFIIFHPFKKFSANHLFIYLRFVIIDFLLSPFLLSFFNLSFSP